MLCSNCGTEVEQNSINCPICGTLFQEFSFSDNEENPKEKKHIIKKYKYLFIICLSLIIIIIGLVLFLNRRARILVDIEKTSYINFKLDNKEFSLGQKVSNYKLNGLSYEDQFINKQDYVESDSIAMYNFYNEKNELQFLGVFYCALNTKCTYDESTLIKINFSPDAKVILDNYIEYGMEYEEIVNKYGKEDGRFYQDKSNLVWTFGDKGKIGTPYYILRFNEGGLMSTGKLEEIRIGVWWYDGEYERTVIKDSEEVTNEK